MLFKDIFKYSEFNKIGIYFSEITALVCGRLGLSFCHFDKKSIKFGKIRY